MRSGADTVQVETCVDKPKPSSVSHHLLLEDAGGLREKLAAPRRGGRVADMGRRQVRESSVAGERASGPPNALTNEARVRISQDVSEPSQDPAAFAELRCVKTPPLHLLAFQPAPRPSGARNSFC